MLNYRYSTELLSLGGVLVLLLALVPRQACADCTPAADCNNKGVCNPQTQMCDCDPPFTGAACENRDPCKIQDKENPNNYIDRPCVSGKCEPLASNPARSECKCIYGWLGNQCEKIDACLLDTQGNLYPNETGRDGPCLNGAPCIRVFRGDKEYSACKCNAPQVRPVCEFDNPCYYNSTAGSTTHPCFNHGNCTMKYQQDRYKQPYKICKCDVGWDDVTFCEKKDPCVLEDLTGSVCKNGAKCDIDRSGSDLKHNCTCSANYDGDYCERINKCGIPASHCHPASLRQDCNPCLNGGLCVSTLEAVPPENPIPGYMDKFHRVHSCDCSKTSFQGDFCEILKASVFIVPEDHKLPVSISHIDSFEAVSGEPHLYFIVAVAFGDEAEIHVDTGDGLEFQLSKEAMKAVPDNIDVLAGLRDLRGPNGEQAVMYYPLWHTYKEGDYVMKVQMLNGGTQSGEEVTNIKVKLPDSVTCIPFARLRNVGHNKEGATEYKRSDTFVIEADLVFDCFEQEWLQELKSDMAEIDRKFRFEWNLHKLTHEFPSPSSENEWHADMLTNTTVKYLNFNSHVLLDGLYWVECRALVKINGKEYGNSEKGFFRINLNPPKIVLRRGLDRIVDGNSDISFDASYSRDDSYPEQSLSLEFKWECNPPCGGLGPWTGSILNIPAETFRSSGVDMISVDLRVTSSHAKTQASTTIKVRISSQAAFISIKCESNCDSLNPGHEVVFVCNYAIDGKPGDASNIKWSWSPTGEVFPVAVDDHPYKMSVILPPVANVLTRSLTCSAKPPGFPQEIASTAHLKINTPPSGGTCAVSPTTGTYLTTEFQIECTSFNDEDLPLEYTFLVEVEQGSSKFLEKLGNRLFLGHDTNPDVSRVYLPFGASSGGNSEVNIIVQVTDDLGLTSETKLPVVVNLPPSGTFNALFSEKIFSDDSLMYKRFMSGDYQGSLQLQMVGLYGLMNSGIAAELSTEEFDKALSLIQELLLETPQHSFKATEQLIYSFHLMDHVENRLDPTVLLTVTRAIHDTSSKLVQFAKAANEVTSSADLEILAEAVTDSGSRLLKASVACANVLPPMVMMTCNERNVLDFDRKDGNNPDSYYEVIEDGLTSSEKEEVGTVSEAAGDDVQDCSKSGRNAIRAIRGSLDGAIGHLGVAVSYSAATDRVSARAQILSQVNSDVNIPLQTSDTTQDTFVNVTIPGETLEIMQERIDTFTTNLELQAIITTDNPYVDDTSACPTTATVFFKVQDAESHVPVTMQKFKEPIVIELPILRPITEAELDVGKSISPVTILPVDKLDDYAVLPTFEMNLPYNSKIIVKISDKSSDTMTFKMAAMRGKRAVLSDFCRDNNAIDVDPDTDIAVFDTEQIGLDEEPEEPHPDYHVSFLAFDFHGTYRNEKFSVSFSRYSCVYRDEDRKFWSETGCMVGNDTTMDITSSASPLPTPLHLSRMKCICNHASIIAGVQFVIPHTVEHSSLISTISIDEIEENPVVFITVCVLLAAYLIILVFCHLFDIRDSKQDVGLTIMADLTVKSEGTKFYLITVVTGCSFWAGTTASVGLVIYGSTGRSKVFTLKDRTNTVFLRGDVDSFLIACDKDLGTLEKIRLWTDHTGVDPAWYCRKILIRCISTDKVWYFYVNNWLTVTAEATTVILEVPATTKEERKRFWVRYKENFMQHIDNANLWLSIFRYSPASNFTRCQRLSSAFAVLSAWLMIDILFHGTPTEDKDGWFEIAEYEIGVIQLIKSFQVWALGFPFQLIIVNLFRSIRSRNIPTLIIWENVIPAKGDLDKRNVFLPAKGDDSVNKVKKVQLPRDNVKVFEFDSSISDEEQDGMDSEIDLRLHPDKLDQISKASTASNFTIPSTDIQELEGWIQDRVDNDNFHSNGTLSGTESDGKSQPNKAKGQPLGATNKQYPFVQNLDSDAAAKKDLSSFENDEIFRLGRLAMISSVREEDPDTFVFQGEHEVDSIENLIDEELRKNRGNDTKPPLKTSEDEEIGEKKIVLGRKKEKERKTKRNPTKKPWKKHITPKYLEDVDQSLEMERRNKEFMHKKANWERQLALEMCQLRLDLSEASYFSLPWWCIFIAWAVCILTIVTCLTFTLMFGVHYGYLRSMSWLDTLFITCVNSFFFMGPLYSIISNVFSTLWGTSQKVKERLQVVIEDISSTKEYLKTRLPYNFNIFRPLRPCEPLKGNEIFRLSIEGRRKKELRGKLIRLILCVTLLVPLIAISYSGHNHYNYEVTHNIRNLFHLNGKGSGTMELESSESVYDYLENVILNTLHPLKYYDGSFIPATAPTLLSDQQTLLVGVGRIRQQRVKPTACKPPIGADKFFAAPTRMMCNKRFRKATQDRENYNPVWDSSSNIPSVSYPSSLTNDGWEFHEADSAKTQSLKYRGKQGTYDGGGYILDLGRNRFQTRSLLKYIKKTNWLDHRSRGIFIELTLMNPNINKFIDVVILIEQGPAGSFSMISWISPMELIPIQDLQDSDEVAWVFISILAIIVILIVWICVFMFDLFNTPSGRRLHQPGLWMDTIIVTFVFASLCVSLVRFLTAQDFAKLIENKKSDEYVSIQQAAYWNDIQRAMFSITQALVFIKFWKLFMLSDKRFLTFALTLKLTFKYMLAFIITLAVLLCAFATFGFSLFGQDLWEYSTFGESLVSLVDQILGTSSFKNLIVINPILGPLFVFLFGYLVIFLALNFVVALLDLGVHEAKEVVQQRKVWLTYSRYFKETLIKSLPFVNASRKQELSHFLSHDKPVSSNTIHPDRWHGMKMATVQYIRDFLEAARAKRMHEMQEHCNLLLAGTGYRMISKRQKTMEKEEERQQHIEQLRRMTSVYIQDKLGHEMKPKEFQEYASFNKQIVKLRIQKMEKTLEKLVDKIEEFSLNHK